MKLGAAECAAGRGPSRALPLPAPLREAAVRGQQDARHRGLRVRCAGRDAKGLWERAYCGVTVP